MLRTKRQIEDEAIAWVIRLRDGGEQDWLAFTSWLEKDAANAAAYEEAALADADAEQLVPRQKSPRLSETAPSLPDEAAPSRFGRRAFLGWGIAASLIIATGYGLSGGSGLTAIETGPGERRQLALDDGSRIELNGGTRIVLDEGRPRFARLEKGEALFRVVHDAARPFEVEAGDALLRDMGTVFNVLHDDASFEVAVSEGAVRYDRSGEVADLKAGMGLRRRKGGRLWVGPVEHDSVGAWQSGRLIYSAAPASRVAADLARNLGLRVSVSHDAGGRPFSGIIMLDGEPTEVLGRASALLGLDLRQNGEGWMLTSESRATN